MLMSNRFSALRAIVAQRRAGFTLRNMGYRSFSTGPLPPWRSTDDLRDLFLKYYVSQGHTHLPSASVVPHNDPSLLFTSAGMVQFKNYFLGLETPPESVGTRVTTSQRCIRAGGKHNDLDNVGHTARHHTYFEMLGNFSFGDYFKQDAMYFAWNFLTKELGLPEERLRISVFETDDESVKLWEQVTGWKDSEKTGKVFRMGAEDNFWQMGDTGPCGPCSEIYWDQLEEVDGDRYLEIWNLVFMQFNRQSDGTLLPLARPCVDTGMGLERLAAVIQGASSNYESDDLSHLVQMVRDFSPISAISGGESSHTTTNDTTNTTSTGLLQNTLTEEETVTATRVIADHIRSITALISDGVTPGNTGRGYVLRRIIRRAARYGVLLGHSSPFMHEIIPKAVAESSLRISTPELTDVDRVKAISRIVCVEEAAFMGSLLRGMRILDSYNHEMMKQVEIYHQEMMEEVEVVEVVKKDGEKSEVNEEEFMPTLPADIVFQLYDTYGFPLDLTQLCAREKGWNIDEEGFKTLLENRRAASRGTWSGSSDDGITAEFLSWKSRDIIPEFIGYNTLVSNNSTIEAVYIPSNEVADIDVDAEADTNVVDGAAADVTTSTSISTSSTSSSVYLSINPSPFYAVGGGQVGDRGVLYIADPNNNDNIHTISVITTHKPYPGSNILEVAIPSTLTRIELASLLSPGTIVHAEVDRTARRRTETHHTATHLLHSALRSLLGDSVQQAGSLVNEQLLRFDFTFSRPLTPIEIQSIEAWVNAAAESDISVYAEEMSLEEAQSKGSIALFGAKYDKDLVRVVQVCDNTLLPFQTKQNVEDAFNTMTKPTSIELCGGTHVHNSLSILPFKIITETGISSGVRRIEAVAGTVASKYLLSMSNTVNSLAPELRLHHLSTPEALVQAFQKQQIKFHEAVDKIRVTRAAQLKKILLALNTVSTNNTETVTTDSIMNTINEAGAKAAEAARVAREAGKISVSDPSVISQQVMNSNGSTTSSTLASTSPSTNSNETCTEHICDRTGFSFITIQGWDVSGILLKTIEDEVEHQHRAFNINNPIHSIHGDPSLPLFSAVSYNDIAKAKEAKEAEAAEAAAIAAAANPTTTGFYDVNDLRQLVVVYGIPTDDASDYEMFRKIAEALSTRQLQNLRSQGIANSLVQAFIGANGKSLVFRTDADDAPVSMVINQSKSKNVAGSKKGKKGGDKNTKKTPSTTPSIPILGHSSDLYYDRLELSASDVWRELETALPGSRGGGSLALAQGTFVIDENEIQPTKRGFARRISDKLYSRFVDRRSRSLQRKQQAKEDLQKPQEDPQSIQKRYDNFL